MPPRIAGSEKIALRKSLFDGSQTKFGADKAIKLKESLPPKDSFDSLNGEGGIRTREAYHLLDFKSSAFDHSATSPRWFILALLSSESETATHKQTSSLEGLTKR